MNRIYFRRVWNSAKDHPSSVEHPTGEFPRVQFPSNGCLDELDSIMRAAADLDDNDH